jgi:hypothetical protein
MAPLLFIKFSMAITGNEKKRIGNGIGLALLVGVMLLSGYGTEGSLHAQDMNFLSFGAGKTRVRLYTDYLCGPCSQLEPRIEGVVADLVKRNVIHITFVDTPFHKYYSVLYAKYFLYTVNEKKEIKHSLAVRALLFQAAKEGATIRRKPLVDKVSEEQKAAAERQRLEEFLHTKGVKFKPFDTKPAFAVFEGYIKTDAINSTPTCVIYSDNRKSVSQGPDNIVKALEGIK